VADNTCRIRLAATGTITKSSFSICTKKLRPWANNFKFGSQDRHWFQGEKFAPRCDHSPFCSPWVEHTLFFRRTERQTEDLHLQETLYQ
jgi:hypothetical protein